MSGAQRLDTSERRPVFVREVAPGTYARVSQGAEGLLRRVERGESFAAIARAASREGRVVTEEEVAASYRALTTRLAHVAATRDRLPRGFWARLRLVPPRAVRAIARPLSRAFDRRVAPLLVACILAGAVVAWRTRALRPFDPGSFWAGYGVFLVALLAHELGHASACARFGAPPGEIGLAAYLVFPTFYSRVSSAWTLRRAERVVVDLGGVYFELLVGALCAFGDALTGCEALHTAVVLIAASCLATLNPILKFDGYWVVSDALGVPNLSRRARGLALRFARFEPLPWPRAVTIALAVYVVVLVAFWIGFARVLVPQIARAAARAPALVVAVVAAVTRGEWPDGAALRELATSAYLASFVAVGGVRAWRAVARRAE